MTAMPALPLSTLRYAIDASGIATITFDAPGARVNTMSLAWQRDLADVADRLVRDKERIAGVLLESAKRSFFAGADLRRLLDFRADDAAVCFAEIEAMKASLRRIETLGRPVVSLLCGSALGGGWDVALAGHARFALDDERIRFGSPEVTLGLVPGTGSITRTVRKLGLLAAQPWLIEGQLFGPREAMQLGWVDGLGASVDDVRAQAVAWIAAHPDAVQPWDRPDYRMPGGPMEGAKVTATLATLPAAIARGTRGLYPAPQAILESMVEGALVDFDTALRIESRKLAKVMVGEVAKNIDRGLLLRLERSEGECVSRARRRAHGASAWAGRPPGRGAGSRARGDARRGRFLGADRARRARRRLARARWRRRRERGDGALRCRRLRFAEAAPARRTEQ